jgi:hypothetical protein
MQNKINLKLDEANELQFTLSIKGSTSENDGAKPNIRFSIVEAKSGIACSFPAQKVEGNTVTVTIPNIPSVFKESIEYKGKLEVFLGNRYFTPTVVDVVFDKPLQIEATLVKTAKKQEEAEDTLLEVESVIKQAKKAETTKKQKPVDQKILQKAMFSEAKPVPTPSVNKKAVVRKPAAVASDETVLTEEKIDHNDPLMAYKAKLKSMIATAIKED